MRYRLEVEDANRFIKAFFGSLFGGRPGNVEAAVRAARLELSSGGLYPPNWSAPVIYRAPGAEPVLPVIVNLLNEPDPPAAAPAVDPKEALRDERDRGQRAEAWLALAQYPGLPLALRLLDDVEERLKARALARGGALLRPARVMAKPESEVVTAVSLTGAVSIKSLKLQLILGGHDARFEGVEPSPALKAGGFELKDITADGTNSLTFGIEAAAETPLPEGELFSVRITTGKSLSVVYPVSVCVLGKEATAAPVQTMDDALIVSAPLG